MPHRALSIGSLAMQNWMSRWSDVTRQTVIRYTLSVFAAIGLMAALSVYQLVLQGENSEEHQLRLDRSMEIRAQVRSVLADLHEAGATQRSFMMTGHREFLEPYQEAAGRLPDAIERIGTTVSEGDQLADAQRLGEVAELFLAELQRGISRRRDLVQPGTGYFLSNDTSDYFMQEIRGLANDLLNAEEEAAEAARLSFQQQTSRSHLIISVLLGGILFLVASSSLLVVSFVERQGRAAGLLLRGKEQSDLARSQAEQASEAKTEFLASMSHEIRTPLTGILGYTELLMEQGLAPDQERYVERIQVAGESLLTVVNDILDFSRIEAGEIAINKHPFAIRALVDNVSSILSGAAQRKGLAVSVRIEPDVPKFVMGDEARIRQILMNVFNNAIKFTDEGSIALSVGTEHTRKGGTIVRFAVTDTGIGIPADKRDRLFRRFSQIDSSNRREFGGTGLGLAISKRLTELMGGEIGLESEEGAGSTFWFALPLPETDAAPEDVSASSQRARRAARILVVEDLEQNRDLVRTMLENAGYSVELAADGFEAVAAVQANGFDLVLMDIQMPGMDGLSATKHIRGCEGPVRDIPIIAMTANVMPQQVKSFRAAGMNGHIGKPFKKAEMIKEIDSWLPPEVDRNKSAEEPTLPAVANANAARDELLAMMGDEWVLAGLAKLSETLRSTFDEAEPGAADRDELARTAHNVVSHAAMLGFPELSRRCSELEEACTAGLDLEGPLQRTREAATSAQAEISAILNAPRST